MLELFNEAATNFNGWCDERNRFSVPLTLDSPVTGPGTALDSMALVSFIMEVEDVFNVHGFKVSLSSAEALEHWDTVGTMLKYLEEVNRV